MRGELQQVGTMQYRCHLLLAFAGPDVGGEVGPYRQTERRELYKQCVDKLVEKGKVYPCFCTDEELDAMKADAEKKSLPPVYRQDVCMHCPDSVTR